MIHPRLCNARPNFYPRSPCGERPMKADAREHTEVISIHALLAESDGGSAAGSWPRRIFLSTLSLRRATVKFSISGSAINISIHALLAESDKGKVTNEYARNDFYPRSPCGERPSRRYPVILGREISIHALLAESDEPIGTLRTVSVNFYPRSPCGERLNTFQYFFSNF